MLLLVLGGPCACACGAAPCDDHRLELAAPGADRPQASRANRRAERCALLIVTVEHSKGCGRCALLRERFAGRGGGRTQAPAQEATRQGSRRKVKNARGNHL